MHFTPLEPQFDDNIDKNLTVPLGSVAYLQCKVKHLGDRMVSFFQYIHFFKPADFLNI